MGTPLKTLRYYHLLIGLAFGLLCLGCADVNIYVAVWTPQPCPNFLKHNQASTPCPRSSSCPIANQTPGQKRPASITVDMGAKTISYHITDQWGIVGCTHDPQHVSLGNCDSTLFTTTFVQNSLKLSPVLTGSHIGEVIISGEDANNNNKVVRWRSLCNNTTPGDDVTWTQLP
jgi:hypothetical protein